MPVGKTHWKRCGKKWAQKNPEKVRERRLRYYRKNRIEILEKVREKKYKRRKYVQKYKLSKGCKICGYNRCVNALCFHHNRGDKEFSIADGIGQCKSLEKLKLEMDKCVVLCRNCHAELHQKGGQDA